MVDEAAAVAGLAGQQAHPVFHVGQRADRAQHLDAEAPGGGRQVHGQQARPAQHQQGAEHDEQDETEVHEQHRIRKEPIDHAWTVFQETIDGTSLIRRKSPRHQAHARLKPAACRRTVIGLRTR